MSKTVKSCIFVALLVFIIGIVGRLDADDEKEESQIYCQNVDDGIWPDFKNVKETACK